MSKATTIGEAAFPVNEEKNIHFLMCLLTGKAWIRESQKSEDRVPKRLPNLWDDDRCVIYYSAMLYQLSRRGTCQSL